MKGINMKKLLFVMMLFCTIGILTTKAQAQSTTYTGTLEVTASNLSGTTTAENQQVYVVDNGTTATLTINGLSIGNYNNVSVEAVVTKDDSGVIGECVSLNVAGISMVQCQSVSGSITSDNCTLNMNLKALYIITVNVNFQSN